MAFVCDATLAEQKVLVTTLGNAVADVEKSKLSPPAIVVIGDVVKLHEGLDWLGAASGKELTPDPLGLNLLDTSSLSGKTA